MTFGGVHSGPNMFGGGDVHDDDLDAGDIAQMKATHYVSEDVNKNYVVDFDGMLKAFLCDTINPCHSRRTDCF